MYDTGCSVLHTTSAQLLMGNTLKADIEIKVNFSNRTYGIINQAEEMAIPSLLPKIAPGAQESQVEYMVIMVLLDLRSAIKQCELFVRIWHAWLALRYSRKALGPWSRMLSALAFWWNALLRDVTLWQLDCTNWGVHCTSSFCRAGHGKLGDPGGKTWEAGGRAGSQDDACRHSPPAQYSSWRGTCIL